jgi:hypothetical protein
VFQTANLEAEPRLNPSAEMDPAIGSVAAKMRGPNHPGMPPYVAFMKRPSDSKEEPAQGDQVPPGDGSPANLSPTGSASPSA